MRVLIAPDKFKDSLSVFEVCDALVEGVKNFDHRIDVEIHPMADGGDGTLDVIERYINCKRISKQVKNPLRKTIFSEYLHCNNRAYIELAQASGLELLDLNDRNPLYTSTFGTGQLILDAIDRGAKEINLFVGGSATNDAAIGIATALGVRFLDENNVELEPIGINLRKISNIDSSNLFFDRKDIVFTVFSDVNNTIYGNRGAAFAFAGQKGASLDDIQILDKGLFHFSEELKKYFNIDVAKVQGGGAAGGVAAGLCAMFGANVESGIDEVIKLTNLEHSLIESDLVITGEGRLDEYSFMGKVVGKVVGLAESYEKRVMVLVGENSLEKSLKLIDEVIVVDSIVEHSVNKEDAILNASKYLQKMIGDAMNRI